MKELTRTELATVKRIAAVIRPFKIKIDKINAKLKALEEEKEILTAQVEAFELPVRNITGGMTAEDFLNSIIEDDVENNTTPEEAPSNEELPEIDF